MSSISSRKSALVDALAKLAEMRQDMRRADPGVDHDCWWTVLGTLCSIAQSIKEAEYRGDELSENDGDAA